MPFGRTPSRWQLPGLAASAAPSICLKTLVDFKRQPDLELDSEITAPIGPSFAVHNGLEFACAFKMSFSD
jgi:hypothetical protein